MFQLFRIASTLRRTAWQALPTVLGIVVLNFLLLQLVPGDAADYIAAESGNATVETMVQLRSQLGLDRSLFEQLTAYLHNLARFDLGVSQRLHVPVMSLIADRLLTTIALMAASLTFALAAGVALGVLMASFANKWQDRALGVFALLLYSTPGFWVGLMAIIVFSVHLGWVPSGGHITPGANLAGLGWLADFARHLVLPAITMATFLVAIFARLTRTSMIEVSRQDFVRTARAKGLRPSRITLGHVLRNALIPVTTVAGMHFGALLGGAVVTEVVFSLPGLGRLAMESVMSRDYPVLLGILFISSLLVIVVNALVDVIHAWLDPRIQPG